MNSVNFTITLPGTDQVKTYGLDGLGNWKTSNFTQVGSGGSTTSTAEVRQHNYVNEITSIKDNTGTPTPYVYDNGNNAGTDFPLRGNGNLVNDGTLLYQYDALNRLTQINRAYDSTVLASYYYGPFNRRVRKTIADLGGGMGGITGDISATDTDYLYDGNQIIQESDHADIYGWTKVYFWGQYVDELMFFSVPTVTTYRVLSDLLYRSVAIVTTANVVTEAYDTDAYGNTLCYSGPGTDGLWFTDDDVRTNNPINTTIFTGRQFDPESLTYYYRARYYSPQIGRFIGRDPLKHAERNQGPNLYWYARCQPIRITDPTGYSGWILDRTYPPLLNPPGWTEYNWRPKNPDLLDGLAVYEQIEVIYRAYVIVRCMCKGGARQPAIGQKEVTLTLTVYDSRKDSSYPDLSFDPAATATDSGMDSEEAAAIRGTAEAAGRLGESAASLSDQVKDSYHANVNVGQWNDNQDYINSIIKNNTPKNPNIGDWMNGSDPDPCYYL